MKVRDCIIEGPTNLEWLSDSPDLMSEYPAARTALQSFNKHQDSDFKKLYLPTVKKIQWQDSDLHAVSRPSDLIDLCSESSDEERAAIPSVRRKLRRVLDDDESAPHLNKTTKTPSYTEDCSTAVDSIKTADSVRTIDSAASSSKKSTASQTASRSAQSSLENSEKGRSPIECYDSKKNIHCHSDKPCLKNIAIQTRFVLKHDVGNQTKVVGSVSDYVQTAFPKTSISRDTQTCKVKPEATSCEDAMVQTVNWTLQDLAFSNCINARSGVQPFNRKASLIGRCRMLVLAENRTQHKTSDILNSIAVRQTSIESRTQDNNLFEDRCVDESLKPLKSSSNSNNTPQGINGSVVGLPFFNSERNEALLQAARAACIQFPILHSKKSGLLTKRKTRKLA